MPVGMPVCGGGWGWDVAGRDVAGMWLVGHTQGFIPGRYITGTEQRKFIGRLELPQGQRHECALAILEQLRLAP